MQSASTKTSTSPVAARAPRFRPSPGPRRSPSRTIAPALRATSGVSSELPESATSTSSGGIVWCFSDSKSVGRYFASFQVGTMTEIRGAGIAPTAARAAGGSSMLVHAATRRS